jgi:hypothetical protein
MRLCEPDAQGHQGSRVQRDPHLGLQ